jgi:hypothetical protein
MEAPRFMAVVWGAGQDGDGPTTIVQLDGQGGLTVVLKFRVSVGVIRLSCRNGTSRIEMHRTKCCVHGCGVGRGPGWGGAHNDCAARWLR